MERAARKPRLEVVEAPTEAAEVSAEEWEKGFHEHFWPAYPRKVAKFDALKAWAKIEPRTEATFNAVMDWLELANAAYARREREKIPHAATVLNGQRWLDEEVE